MLITRPVKGIIVCEVATIEELEVYIRSVRPDFKNFVNVSAVEELLKNDSISTKKLMLWCSKVVNGGSRRATVEYWIRRGHSEEEAKKKVTEVQQHNSAKHCQNLRRKQASGENWKKEFNTTSEYYEARGASHEEAIRLAHERQITFSLQKCIARHGEVEGVRIWSQRQDKWLATLNAKSDAEKFDIKRRRVVPMGRASKESLKIFLSLYRMLIDKGVCKDEDVFFGLDERKEWFLADTENFFLYDFCVPKFKLILEYQGSVWHPDYRLNEEQLKSWKSLQSCSAEQIIKNDETKRLFAEARGFRVVYVWGSDDSKVQMQCAFDALKEVVEATPFVTTMSNVPKLLSSAHVAVSTPAGFSDIVEFHVKEDKQLYELLLSDGRRLRCSDDHYIRLSTGQWACVRDLVAAKEVTFSSLFIETDTGLKTVLAIADVGKGVVNDLTVQHLEHFYYANGITSHNTGKTLLSIAASLEQLRGVGDPSYARYDKLIVTRPVQPLGKDIGFLPGTMEEKMEPWIAPIRDNLNFLMGPKRGRAQRHARREQQQVTTNDSHKGLTDNAYLKLLQDKGLIEIEAITFIRGRSIPNAILLVDECQNLTMHELKTIITRVGDGTKVILSGDTSQIDNVHVDIFTNGLTYAIEKFKDYPIAGHISLLKGERSELASIASRIL